MLLYGDNNSGGSSGNGGQPNGSQPSGGQPGGGPQGGGSSQALLGNQMTEKHKDDYHKPAEGDKEEAMATLEEMAQRSLYKQDNYSTMTPEQKKVFIKNKMREILLENTKAVKEEAGNKGPAARYPGYDILYKKLVDVFKK